MKWSERIDDLINLLIFLYFFLPAIKRFLKRFRKTESVSPRETVSAQEQAEAQAQQNSDVLLTRIRGRLRQIYVAQAELAILLDELEVAMVDAPGLAWKRALRASEEGFSGLDRLFRQMNQDMDHAALTSGRLLDDYQALFDEQDLLREDYRRILALEAQLATQKPVVEAPQEIILPLLEEAPEAQKAQVPVKAQLVVQNPNLRSLRPRQKVLREAVLLRSILGQRTSYFP
jgi:hypothetical protein